MSRSGLRGTLFRKYAACFAGLVSVALLASGLTGMYFDYRQTLAWCRSCSARGRAESHSGSSYFPEAKPAAKAAAAAAARK